LPIFNFLINDKGAIPMTNDVIKVKVSERYSNQFVTTIKGYIFYKDHTTDYLGDDKETDSLLRQGILVIEENKELLLNLDKDNIKELVSEEKELESSLNSSEENSDNIDDDNGNNDTGLFS